MPELCKTAAHLRECGECADEIEGIVKNALQAIAVPPVEVPEEVVRDANGIVMSGLITSHADVANAVDHPIEYGEQCGLCIANKAKAGQKPSTPAALITQLERL